MKRVTPKKHYHHGALQEALVEAADRILDEGGVEAFSLREAARRAGVSPAAPAHHFGSAAGLLTEVAIRAFNELTRFLRTLPARRSPTPESRLIQQGVSYVRFALAYPGRFRLMFRKELLIADEPRLQKAAREAYFELESVVADHFGVDARQPLDWPVRAAVLAAWSMAHGFAHLALAGRLDAFSGTKGLDHFVSHRLRDVLRAFRLSPRQRSEGALKRVRKKVRQR